MSRLNHEIHFPARVDNLSMAVDARRWHGALSTASCIAPISKGERDSPPTAGRQPANGLSTAVFVCKTATTRCPDSSYDTGAAGNRQTPAEHYYYDCF